MGGLLSDGKFILGIIFALWGICSATETPANFVFGDSLVEVGNNNYIVTLSKANYYPNGIDFGKPTGRYTNGRTIIDIIDQSRGFKGFTPPYLAPTTAGPVILRGVNYASGGAGILNETGKIFGGRINMDAQIDNFANTRQDIISGIGVPAALKLLKRALFSLTIGSNDFINNYLAPIIFEAERKSIPPETFVGILIARFRLQITRLYSLGAKKIVMVNVGPIGCIPYQREVNRVADPDSCAAFSNQLARSFNAKLKTLVTELNKNLPGAKFVYADVYTIVEDIIDNYKSYGFQNTNSACCRVAGRYGGLIPCGPQPSKVCVNRSKYVFWDAYHPSDASNVIIARRLLLLGCIPYQREVNRVADPDSCAAFPNQLARSFNAKLRTLVTELNNNLPGAKFVYADVYSIVEDIIDNYKSYGFQNTNSACCRVAGRYGGLIPCGPQPSKVCVNRSKYVFWDAYHPSDASNVIIASRQLYGNSSDISPMNIVQLLQAS